MTKLDYVAEATVTLSNQFHGELVNPAQFKQRLMHAIVALAALDTIKKAFFYGRDFPERIAPPNVEAATAEYDMLLTAIGGGDKQRGEWLVHGIVGVATEAGELLEALDKALSKAQPIDLVNLREETGDCKWYLAVLAKAGGYAWSEDEAINIAKLRKRFPNAFTEHDAVTRDLDAERKVLEGDKGLCTCDNPECTNMHAVTTMTGPTDSELARARLAENVGMTEAQRDAADRGRKYFKGE